MPMCSTPFGIHENLTGSATACSAAATRCSTPFGIHENLTRYRDALRAAAIGGAQRLAASTKISRHSVHPRGVQCDVLNAFRHPRKSHRLGVVELEDCAGVLNDFRRTGQLY